MLRDPVGRLLELQLLEQLLEFLPVLRRLDRVHTRPDDRDPGGRQGSREIQRRLSAELDDHPVRLDPVADVQHVLGRQRLEEQQVARIVVGADRLGIGVDHDRLDTQLAHAKLAWQQQ